MFLSNLFAQTFANLSGCTVELYNTDGALGAARGAGFGAGYYTDFRSCFNGMEMVKQVDPQIKESELIREIYQSWKEGLFKLIKIKTDHEYYQRQPGIFPWNRTDKI